MKATNEKAAGKTASGARVRLDEIRAEQIAFLPDSISIRGAIYFRVCWIYEGEGDRLARVGYGYAHSSAVPRWATPGCGSARRGMFVLGDVRRRGAVNSRNGWDILIDRIDEGRAE